MYNPTTWKPNVLDKKRVGTCKMVSLMKPAGREYVGNLLYLYCKRSHCSKINCPE